MAKAITGRITLNLIAGIIITVVTVLTTIFWMAARHNEAAAKSTAKSDTTRKQANAVSGAQPAAPSNGFDSRFSAMR